MNEWVITDFRYTSPYIFVYAFIVNMKYVNLWYIFESPAKIKRQGNQPFFFLSMNLLLQVSTRLNFPLFTSLLLKLSPLRAIFCNLSLTSFRVDVSFKILQAAQWIFNENFACDTCFFCRALRLTSKADRGMVLCACKSNEFHLRRYILKLSWVAWLM